MNKLEVFVISLLLTVTLALGAGAVYQQRHSQNVKDTAVVKAQNAEKKAEETLNTYKLNLQAANTQIQSVAAQKVAACAALTAHKLTDPACTTTKE